jgi:hypothetical protein
MDIFKVDAPALLVANVLETFVNGEKAFPAQP